MKPKAETLTKSIAAVIANGKMLLDDARLLFGWDRFATALALAVLAQEEFSKSFLLRLVQDEALPWLPEVQRSMAIHQCKHLLALVMEWLPPFDMHNFLDQARRREAQHNQWMAWAQRRLDRYKSGNLLPDPEDPEPVESAVSFPADVANALNIYRHEQIEKLGSREAWKADDWATGNAREIANGLLDRKKQSGFYVDVTKTGELGLRPGLITREEAAEAIDRAERLSEDPDESSGEYRKLKETLPLVFSNLKRGDAG